MHSILHHSELRQISTSAFEPIHTRKYTLRLAENAAEVEEALRLRFRVFNLELGEGLSDSYRSLMDRDAYDDQCDHLIVIDNEGQEIIGTYRLQDHLMARTASGFYTQNEFDLDFLPKQILHNAVELGRACIHKDHRSGRVLYLLWKGIASYVIYANKRYLFGCCSLNSQDPIAGWTLFRYLKNNGNVHRHHFSPVQPAYRCDRIDFTDIHDSENVQVPDLFRMYLSIGAKVCSAPALDREFKTIDFLILLDIDQMSPESRQLFFK